METLRNCSPLSVTGQGEWMEKTSDEDYLVGLAS
jgi:hypothetical protein